MGDQLVLLEEMDSHFQLSISTLNDLIERENVEYLESMEGVQGISRKLSTSTTTGFSADEVDSGFEHRIS
jgi:hypothetical protein